MNKAFGTKSDFRIEVEESPLRIVIVLDRKYDVVIVPSEDALRFAETMDQVYEDFKDKFTTSNVQEVIDQQDQIRMAIVQGGGVAMVVKWTDRITFTSLDAFYLVSKALRKCAQDSDLAIRGVHIKYNKQKMIKSIHNSKTGETQIIPGR